MKAVMTQTMRDMDARAIQDFHIPSIVLMEHAAMALATYIESKYDRITRFVIVCGPGNNGGDGYALAHLLYQHGYLHVTIISLVDQEQMSQDERIEADIARAYGIKEYHVKDEALFYQIINECDVMIDAIFGTGLSREITGMFQQVITRINNSKKTVISIDIASGISGDHGNIMGCAIQASETLTFECMKVGQLIYPGSLYSGKITVLSIDMPKSIVDEANGITILDDAYMKAHLPIRNKHSHKGSFGKCLMIGGSKRMHGALCMAAKACLKSGVGTLTLFVPDCIGDVVASKFDEAMIIRAKSDEDGYFDQDAILELKQHLSEFEYIVIGNGMGRNDVSKALVQCVLKSDRTVIVDGDALYELGACPSYLQRPYTTILTPHIKEMSYVSGYSIPSIVEDPMRILQDFVKRYPEVTICLKDQYTWIANRKECMVNIAGNASLAKGGSGDVLCGFIAGLYGQCKQALDACGCGVYAHARLADELLLQYDENSILPSMLIEEVSSIYKQYR